MKKSKDRKGRIETEFTCLHELVKKAHARLDQHDWDHIAGGTESETTLRRNRWALDSLAFRPRVLRNVSKIDTSVEWMGRRLRLPVVLAPIGSNAHQACHPDGAVPVVRAAHAFGVAHMLSSVGHPELEDVAAAAPDALRIFQLYVQGDDGFVDERVSRAIAAGYAGVALTVDVAIYSRRERDIAGRHTLARPLAESGRVFQAELDWKTVARLKSKFKIPLGIKGIATAEDARIALDHGVDWIYVSNHGGRQLDHGRGALQILPEVVETVAGRATIIVDGSILRGSDVVKALATGANLVGIGKLQCCALAAAGEAGVLRMLELLEDEAQRCLGLVGVNSFADLNPSYLEKTVPMDPPHVFSAFPLLKLKEYLY